jgi:hypothetical protein
MVPRITISNKTETDMTANAAPPDALSAKPTSVREDDGTVLGNVLVELYADLGIAQ